MYINFAEPPRKEELAAAIIVAGCVEQGKKLLRSRNLKGKTSNNTALEVLYIPQIVAFSQVCRVQCFVTYGSEVGLKVQSPPCSGPPQGNELFLSSPEK